MPDETPAPTTPDAAKTARRKPSPVDAPAPEAPAAGFLRYTGQTPRVFLSLGGEIAPGQVIRVTSPDIAELLVEMGDFETADEPAAVGTAN